MLLRIKHICIFLLLLANSAQAQIQLGGEELNLDYSAPKEYEIGGVTVSGTRYLDENVLINISGLSIGRTIDIPGEAITDAIQNLWKQGLFSDIKVQCKRIKDNKVFLDIELQERPRLNVFSFSGARKSEVDKLREDYKIQTGNVVTQNMLTLLKNKTEAYYHEKGFLNAMVNINEVVSANRANHVDLTIAIEKGERVKIKNINFIGNENLSDAKLKRAMKETKEKKWWRIFGSSKFIPEKYTEDKVKVIEKYTDKGFRDANILSDSTFKINTSSIALDIKLEEGRKYYFRNITWVGNTKHTAAELNQILGVKKGDVYNQAALDQHLFMNQTGRDVSSLYMDDGYLFFNVTPVEIAVENDSIDFEMRIYEGKQATVNKVTVMGNTKTNDRVIMREIRTKPGQLFSRNDIVRTTRELAQLGYFDPEKIGVNPKPNPADGTVDIEYTVEEKPSDQLELQGGYGANQLVGSLGVTLNNFSARNMFKKGGWRPLPSGDGQRMSARVQTNGVFYQMYSLSFTEPYLGGKKPNSFSVNIFHSAFNRDRLGKENPLHSGLQTTGASIGLGKRLKWPDDYFTYYGELNYQYYEVYNQGQSFAFNNGFANNFNISQTLSRKSIDQPIYPRKGSDVNLSLQVTPPYSLISGKDFSGATERERYKFIEYHKWKFTSNFFATVVGDLVFNASVNYGFLGLYNRDIGPSPFERFYLGGDGLSNFTLDGREIIRLRGYSNFSLSPSTGGTIFDKYTVELRYPLSLNPSATIYLLTFAEGGNSWVKFRDFNPFDVKRSVGAGVRIFLPIFGMLGLDYGIGFDPEYGNIKRQGNTGQFHFMIGQQF